MRYDKAIIAVLLPSLAAGVLSLIAFSNNNGCFSANLPLYDRPIEIQVPKQGKHSVLSKQYCDSRHDPTIANLHQIDPYYRSSLSKDKLHLMLPYELTYAANERRKTMIDVTSGDFSDADFEPVRNTKQNHLLTDTACYRSNTGAIVIEMPDSDFNQCDLKLPEMNIHRFALVWTIRTYTEATIVSYNRKYGYLDSVSVDENYGAIQAVAKILNFLEGKLADSSFSIEHIKQIIDNIDRSLVIPKNTRLGIRLQKIKEQIQKTK